jgi:hypothetical protein
MLTSVEPASAELAQALSSLASFDAWLASRGYQPEAAPLPSPQRAILAGARPFFALGQNAPRMLVLWKPEMRERSVQGNELRKLQREANHYVTRLKAEGAGDRIPNLCAVASHEFLLAFPLDGNPFARRLRFTPDRLRPGSPLTQHFLLLSAAHMAGWVRTPPAATQELLANILGTAEPRSWDFSRLFVGSSLDNDFVAFMAHSRQRIASLLIDTRDGQRLLKSLWPHLKEAARAEDAGKNMPPLQEMVRQGRYRHALVATVDTVLLRLVLYRYLEAQFGYTQTPEEQKQVAFGSYDELLEQTTRFDAEALAGLLRRIRAGETPASLKSQLDLFQTQKQQLVRFTDEERFAKGLRQRAERYQTVAGGDLHHGSIAEAADLLQEFLLEYYRNDFALLLEGTRTEQYSFHYADLDPRAFQRFYEQTIGTDIRVTYDKASGELQVDVVGFERNRKEQGAYFTDERLCGWLAERTLGQTYTEWKTRLAEFLKNHARQPAGRLPELRALLDELLGWRILDPTCGGGIFLRAAFEYLSKRREEVVDLLSTHLPEEVFRELTSRAPYALFRTDAEPGHWEWHILLHMLYGVDVDVKAVNVASNLLTLSALSYKRHGLCFPSFINTSLKRGNALVPLLAPEERGAFAGKFRKELKQLIKLRGELRDPNLPRGSWKAFHREAANLSRDLVQMQIIQRFSDLFPGLSEKQLIERVQEVGVFFYEVEFPEVFFDASGKPLPNPGFNVVLGNPPWEEPAAELKQFLPEFDLEYRALSGQSSAKREKDLLKDPEIKHRWEVFEQSVEDYKTLLTSGWYEHQQRAVHGKTPGAHTNLYKYATELSWKVLNDGGRAGLVLDGGLWGDLASSGLRALLLDQSSDAIFCGFTNNRGIFPDVHRSYKFGACVFRKGGRTDLFRAVFMRDDLNDLERFEALAVSIPADDIRHDRRDNYPVPEVRSSQHSHVERRLTDSPSLGDAPWSLDTLAEEFNAGRQRGFFHPKPRQGFIPLIQGQQFNLFGVHQGELPDSWLDPSNKKGEAGEFIRDRQTRRILRAIADYLEERGLLRGGREAAALNWVRGVSGKRSLPDEWLRLDWDGYRIAWRDIARNDDRRTLITAILPPRVGVSHKAPFVKPFRLAITSDSLEWSMQYSLPQLLYLAGALSSFVCDSLARSRVTKTNLNSYIFLALNVPPWNDSRDNRRVAELTARLTCLPATVERPWADYTELAASVGLKPKRDGLTDPQDRREAEIELNALMAQLYGLGRSDFRFLMDLLFMTREHRETHALMRDEISRRLPEEVVASR